MTTLSRISRQARMRRLAGPAVGLAVGLALAPFALSPLATKAMAKSTEVSFGYNDWIGFAPLFVASEKGFFGDYPLKFVHLEDGINAALLSGAIQTADLSMNEVIEDHVKHFDVRIVMPIDYSDGADAIVAKNSVAKLADMKGQTVPLDTTSYSELLLVYALKQAGLSIHDVRPVQMDASAVPAALVGGHAEAGVTWAPHVDEVTKDKSFHVLYSSADAPGLVTDNLAVKASFLKANPGAIQAIIRGYLKGRAYLSSNPDESMKIVGKRLGIAPEDAAAQYKLVVSPDLAQMMAMMTGKGDAKVLPYSRNIELVHAVMIDQGAIKANQNVTAEAMLDPDYVVAVSKAP